VLQVGMSRVLFPYGVVAIFHWHNPLDRIMYLGSTQPLTEMSRRVISWRGKGGRCLRLTLQLLYADYLEIWDRQPPGNFRANLGMYRDFCTFTLKYYLRLRDMDKMGVFAFSVLKPNIPYFMYVPRSYTCVPQRKSIGIWQGFNEARGYK